MDKKILHIPSLDVFNGNINLLFLFLKRRGYPKWSLGESLNLYPYELVSLRNLVSIRGSLNLNLRKKITTLGCLEYVGDYVDLFKCENLISLGNLRHVDSHMSLAYTPNLTSFGNLEHINGDLFLFNSKIREMYSDEEIRKMVKVKGIIK